MTRLALIAHASTTATRCATFADDESVDTHGFDAARTAAVRRHAAVYCGPERRCAQTASALRLTPRIDPELRDLDHGQWRGRSLDDVAGTDPAGVRAWLTDPDAAPHGGETIRVLLDRVGDWLRAQPSTSDTVVVVTHPAVVRAAIVAAVGAEPAGFWRIDVPPLTETLLIGGEDRWTLRRTGCALGPRA